MESYSIVFTFKLANESRRNVTINDINPSITEQEIIALGNKLIELRCEYSKSPFVELEQSKKVTVIEEIF